MVFSVSLEDSRVIHTEVILLVLVRALPCTGMLCNIKQYSLNAQKCGDFSFTGVHCPSHRRADVKFCFPANTIHSTQRRANS